MITDKTFLFGKWNDQKTNFEDGTMAAPSVAVALEQNKNSRSNCSLHSGAMIGKGISDVMNSGRICHASVAI